MKFTNRFIAMILCIAMLSAVACLSVSALVLYPVGDWVYQPINNSTEFEIYAYNGTQSSAFTPYSHNGINITTVGSNAFDGNTTLQKVTLSKYITTVNNHAFLSCSALQTVVFQGQSVTTINEYAFAECKALTTIQLENTLIEKVSVGTFMNCDSLTEITVPDTVTSIEENAFGYCDSLAKVVIPASVTSIDPDAFHGSDNVVIHCYENSLAHRYAVNNSIEFVLLDAVKKYMLGDLDDNNEVSIMDATAVQLLIAELMLPEDEYTEIRGDIDGDNVLSIMDATSIQRFVASYDDGNHIGEYFEY